MKRFLGFILDVLFFVSFLCVALMLGIFLVYQKAHDISIINVYLQTELIKTLLITYVGYVVLYFVYYWFLPTMLKQTVGQRLTGTSYDESEKKAGLGQVFLLTIVGRFWDIVLFPYTLFALITKRPIISTRMSGITMTKQEKKPSAALYIATTIFTLFLIGTLAVGTYVYKTGITPIMERYTNYEKQVTDLMGKLAYQDASTALDKYKQYNGEDASYAYYRCIIAANLSTDLAGLDTCKTALDANTSNIARTKEILSQEAKLYAANNNYKDAETLYAKLWNDYQDRSMEMKNYVVVLSEEGKSKDATTILDVLAKQVSTDDPIALRDLGNLYERINNTSMALAKYQAALALIGADGDQSLAGELQYNIGVIYYKQTKYTDAVTSLNAAKTLNPDYADAVDSYIILINKLKGSVTK